MSELTLEALRDELLGRFDGLEAKGDKNANLNKVHFASIEGALERLETGLVDLRTGQTKRFAEVRAAIEFLGDKTLSGPQQETLQELLAGV